MCTMLFTFSCSVFTVESQINRDCSAWKTFYVSTTQDLSSCILCTLLLLSYCDCFANGEFCREGCHCHNCKNNMDHAEERAKAVKVGRNSTSFTCTFTQILYHVTTYPSHGSMATVIFLCVYMVLMLLTTACWQGNHEGVILRHFLKTMSCHEVKRDPWSRWSLCFRGSRLKWLISLLVVKACHLRSPTEAPTKCS